MSNKNIITLILLLATVAVSAQTGYNSPYSKLGMGKLHRNGFAANRAIGGISSSMRSENTINYMNPASYSSQDTGSFLFEVGLYTGIHELESNQIKETFYHSNFEYLAMSFPIAKWWGSSIGLTPYSRSAYNIKEENILADGSDFMLSDNYYKGTGGLNQIYWGHGISLFDRISLGVNISYIFGSFQRNETLDILNDAYSYTQNKEKQTHLSGLLLTYGIQGFFPIKDKYFINIGSSFENQTSLKGRYNFTYYNSYNSIIIYNDTLANGENNKIEHILPTDFCFGFSTGIKNTFIFGVDFRQQAWSASRGIESSDVLNDYQSIRAGLQWIPKYNSIRNYFQRVVYSTGIHYDNTHMSFKGEQINDFGISFGLGLPIRNTKTQVNISCELGRLGTNDLGLIKENYGLLTLSVKFYDNWFVKRKYD